MRHGKTRQQEKDEAEVARVEAEKRLQGETDITDEESLARMKGQMGNEAQAELEAMLTQGLSLKDIMNHFMAVDPAVKLRKLLQRTDLSDQEKLELALADLTDEQRQQVENLLRSGFTPDQVLEHLAKEAEAKKRSDAILADPNLSQEEKLQLLKGDMDPNCLKEVEEMLKMGMSLEDALNAIKIKENEARAAAILADPNLTSEEKLNLLKGDISASSLKEIEEMLKQGVSLEDALKLVKNKESAEKKDSRTAAILANPNLTTEEKLNLIKGEMSAKCVKDLEEFLKQGMSLEDALKEIKKKGAEREKKMSSMEREVLEAMSGGMSTDQVTKKMYVKVVREGTRQFNSTTLRRLEKLVGSFLIYHLDTFDARFVEFSKIGNLPLRSSTNNGREAVLNEDGLTELVSH